MTTVDVIEETYAALTGNKARSFLTMLGIIIGISSVIAMVAIGQGSQSSVQAKVASLGANLIQVMPGATRGPGYQVSQGRGTSHTLVPADADAITAGVSGITAVTEELSGRYQVTAKGTNTNTSVDGTTSNYPAVKDLQIDQGSFFTDEQNQSLARVAVIGPTVRDDLFGAGADAVGSSILIKNITFQVIGVTVAKGTTGFQSQDDMIFIPIKTAQQFLFGAGDPYVSSIDVEATNQNDMTAVQQDITDLLLTRHNISDPTQADFSILNQATVVATASSVTQTFTILLGAVAGISLLVGGIGIMNMMLTTVTERTKEIGLRKSIGAKRREISLQFLAEATALTFIGGLIGIILGCSVAYGLNYFGIVATSISASSIVLAFVVSAATGIIFGYYPASRAAALNPITALRFE